MPNTTTNIHIHTRTCKHKHKHKVQDESFRAKLEKEGFKFFEMASDGNCLFRAVAHQIYGCVPVSILSS